VRQPRERGGPLRRILNFAALVCGGVLGLVALFGLYEAMAGGGTDTVSPPKHAGGQENSVSEHRGYDAASTVKGVLGALLGTLLQG
jgi:hypothetical protein